MSLFGRPVPFRHPKTVCSLILAAAVLCLYSVSLGHNFLFDEDDIILLNPMMRDLKHLPDFFLSGFFQQGKGIATVWEQYYRPLTAITFALDYSVWKVNPMGYNLTNTMLHIAVCVLLFLLLLRIFRSHFTAFVPALLYAVHTLHTEAVTYIASRGDLLGGLCTLAAMLLFWRGLYLATFAVYLLSLFCKESCLLLPLYLVLVDVVFIRTAPRRLFVRLLPLLAAGAGYVAFRKLFSPVPMGPPSFDEADALFRFFSMGPPILSYFKALLAPEPFKFCEEITFATRWTDPRVVVTIAVYALLGSAWLLALRRRGAAFFGLTLFALSFGPSLQIIPFFPQWAEHYLYIPSMGLAILLGCLLREIRAAGSKAALAVFFAAYLPFTAFISWRTVERNLYYADNAKYYEALSRSESPYAYYGYINLAIMAIMKESWDDAFVPLATAHRINPEAESNNYNLGLYYFNKSKFEKAMGYFKKAYETDMGNHQPVHLLAQGMCLSRLGRYEEAVKVFEVVHQSLPEASSLYKNIIRSYELWGKPEEALGWAERGLTAIDPARAKIDHASVLMEAFVVCYLNQLDGAADKYLDLLLKEHHGTPWYGDAARFLKGEVTPGEYEDIVQEKYPYNAKDARLYMLMGAVRGGRWKEVSEFLDRYGAQLKSKTDDPLIIARLLGRAEAALAAQPASP